MINKKAIGVIHLVRTQNFSKSYYPLIRTRMCAYQKVRNVSFSKNFVYVLNGWLHSVWMLGFIQFEIFNIIQTLDPGNLRATFHSILIIWKNYAGRKQETVIANVPFLYSLKTSEDLRFSDISRGYRNGTLTGIVLITVWRHEKWNGKKLSWLFL